jgi:hypothetical protein
VVAESLAPLCYSVLESADFVVFSCKLRVSQGVQLRDHAIRLLDIGLHGREFWAIVDHMLLGY